MTSGEFTSYPIESIFVDRASRQRREVTNVDQMAWSLQEIGIRAVIGSGFGGSVAALRLAEKGYKVAVLETGLRLTEKDFAVSSWDLRRFFWVPRLGFLGPSRVSMFKDVFIGSGAGVGGGSLVYAKTLSGQNAVLINNGQLATGIYFLKLIYSSGKEENMKFIQL